MTMEKQRNNKSGALFWIYIFAVFILKLFLTAGLRAWGFMNDQYDDAIMVRNASNLISFKWLGGYDQYTLTKGVTFPLYLMFIHRMGIPYLLANSIMCFAACLVFIMVIKKLIPQKKFLGFFYTILMFNPITFHSWSFNRVYRDSIYTYLVILLFSFVIAMYLNRKDKLPHFILYAVGVCFFLIATWHAREDSVWVVPFVAAALGLTVIFIITDKQIKDKLKRIVTIAVIPVLLFVSIFAVSTINYSQYGYFGTTELTGGALPELFKELSIIKPDKWMQRCSIPESTLQKAYSVSPTFATVKPLLENHIFMIHAKKNASCQMFVWALRDCVNSLGYSDAKSSQEFYQKSADEIKSALETGKLQSRGGYVHMFVSPWSSDYVKPLTQSFLTSAQMTVTMSGYDKKPLPVQNIQTFGTPEQIKQMEYVTNNVAFYSAAEIPSNEKTVKMLGGIAGLYKILNPIFTVLGLLCWVYLLLRVIFNIHKKIHLYFDTWIIATGLFLSYLVRLFLISYTDASAIFSLYPMYLATCYMLLPMGSFLCIFVTAKDFLRLKDKKMKKA